MDARASERTIDERTFPFDASADERARFLIQYAVLAASSHDTEPWSFRVSGDTIGVFADARRQLQVADPDRRELFLSVGAALENLVLAAQHFGYGVTVAYDGTDEASVLDVPIATVELTFAGDRGARSIHPHDARLFAAIGSLAVDRGDLVAGPMPPQLVSRLSAHAEAMETDLAVSTEPRVKAFAAEIGAEAERLQFGRREFRRELGDRVGAGALGTPWPLTWVARWAVARLDLGPAFSDRVRHQIERAPAVGFLLSRAAGEATAPWERREAIVRAGRALQRVALALAAEGFALRTVDESLELPPLRSRLARLIDRSADELMTFFRIGRPQPATVRLRRGVRRRIEDVIAR